MSKKITAYIAGKVTGEPRHTCSMKFGTLQKTLMSGGYTTIVPLDIVPPDSDWPAAMRICIAALMTADVLHLLPDWSDSRGARLERDIALRLGIPIVYH